MPSTDSRTLADLPNRPGTNWVEKAGGLPDLHKRIAKHLVRERGMTEDRAYATAVSQVRKVCATGRTFGGKTEVSAKTKAEYCAAAAAFEKLRGKNAARRAVEAPARLRVREATEADIGAIAAGARKGIEARHPRSGVDALLLEAVVGSVEAPRLVEAGAFDEARHRRGRGGRFADIPGVGDDAPKAEDIRRTLASLGLAPHEMPTTNPLKGKR